MQERHQRDEGQSGAAKGGGFRKIGKDKVYSTFDCSLKYNKGFNFCKEEISELTRRGLGYWTDLEL